MVIVASCCIVLSLQRHDLYQGPRTPPRGVVPSGELRRMPLRKTVWLLWFQGWDDAPWLVRNVRASWELLNPQWDIVSLSDDNLEEYMPPDVMALLLKNADTMSPAAKSDLIRLNLLANQGGVWADATMVCMQPLDAWVHDAIQPSGFWMYHGRDEGAGPASWFMVSKKGSYIACAWRDEAVRYWKSRTEAHNYFWMDELFKTVHDNDDTFKHEWARVPYTWCEDPGQSHMLAQKVMDNDPELHRIMYEDPPYAIKLSHHGFDESKESNGYHAIQAALRRAHHIATPT